MVKICRKVSNRAWDGYHSLLELYHWMGSMATWIVGNANFVVKKERPPSFLK